MSARYIPTGNEYVSLPDLDEKSAALGSFSVLHMAAKGLIELHGEPVMEPFFSCGALEDLSWTRRGFWVPEFTARSGELKVSGTLLAPAGERGFIWRLRVENAGSETLSISYGLRGVWRGARLAINESKEIYGVRRVTDSLWNSGPVFALFAGLPLLAFAPMCDREISAIHAETDGSAAYTLERFVTLAPGQSEECRFYWGLGYEEVAAATSAKEMLRQGWERELDKTLDYLAVRSWHCGIEDIERLYNTNMFFCLFYSAGLTLDTEVRVLVTSRSPRYYVSAAYWDRDSLLWTFPTLLDADSALAREALLYAFGRQARNIGVHSRYIDGSVLEPGFELDELAAPVIALERYVKATGDESVLSLECVPSTVNRILRTLEAKRHGEIEFYETFLMPTDDVLTYPYLTYDNVLVWRTLGALARLWPHEYGGLAARAERVRSAILAHCTADGAQGKYFVWSTDLAGHSDVYDEPPGSLLLLPYLGFCACDDPVWLNTVRMIRSRDYALPGAAGNHRKCHDAARGCHRSPESCRPDGMGALHELHPQQSRGNRPG